MSASRKVTLQFSQSRWHLWSRFKGEAVSWRAPSSSAQVCAARQLSGYGTKADGRCKDNIRGISCIVAHSHVLRLPLGTVVQKTWKSVLFLTVFNAILCVKVHIFRDLIPTFRAQMEMLDKLWHMQMTLTTFILAFFLNKSYSVWTDMLSLGRRIQGR